MRRRSSARPTVSSPRLYVERLEDRTLLNGGPEMLAPGLGVRTVFEGLVTPTSLAFLGRDDFFVLEKNTGKVIRVEDGAPTTVLDLAVNNASERGLLGIALDPDFDDNGFVYLYWTQPAAPPPADNPFVPTVVEGPDVPALGADTGDVLAVPLLGNRVDRFVWDGDAETLTFDENLIKLRSFQNDGAPTPAGQGDEEQPPLGNHDGGVITFGPDGKLYVIVGDVGRRGWLQNLPDGPTAPGVDDDQFGGPEPDDAHLTGVVLRLNPDGTAPADNPFFEYGAELIEDGSAEVGENLQLVYAYGIRNSFGMTFDPISGTLWTSENADDSFDEINRVEPGFNSGWVQIMGPASRVAQFKEIETSEEFFGLQQLRWSPENIADTTAEALERLFVLPGSHYSDPEFSWKFAVPPTALAFVPGRGLGPQYAGDLIVGNGAGQLMHFNLTGNRRRLALEGRGLQDRVDDNLAKFVPRESARLVIGEGFGIVTDIEASPRGSLYVVSLTNGAVYEVFGTGRNRKEKDRRSRTGSRTFVTRLSGAEEVPPRDTRARGQATFRLSKDGTELSFQLTVANIRNVVAAHIHLGEEGENGPVVVTLFESGEAGGGRTNGVLARGTITADDLEGPLEGATLQELVDAMLDGGAYVNVHTDDGEAGDNTGPGDFIAGEIRGQIESRGRDG